MVILGIGAVGLIQLLALMLLLDHLETTGHNINDLFRNKEGKGRE